MGIERVEMILSFFMCKHGQTTAQTIYFKI